MESNLSLNSMKNRQWKSQEKLMIVLEGMRSTVSLAELCSRHQITQSQYYLWRDRLLKQGQMLFEHGGPDKRSNHLENENRQLKGIIGELTVELKKTEKLINQW